MKHASTFFAVAALVATCASAMADDHFDIAPYFQNGKLLTGGLTHGGVAEAPPIQVYGLEFGEDPNDPFNPADPGVNQAAGIGNLPAGAAVKYNILSSLLFWDGVDPVHYIPVPGDTHINLFMGTAKRTLTGSSGPQTGSLIQSVAGDGSMHKHFVTALHADYDDLLSASANVPGDPDFTAPPEGIYAFSLELTLTNGGNTYVADPLWVVYNNGLSEEQHAAAMNAVVPEPSSMALLGLGGLALLGRQRRSVV